MRTVLAIDGGNSKTDVALVAEDGTLLATARGGRFQPQRAGVGPALDVLAQTVRQALGTAPAADLVSAYLAGADFPAEERELRDALTERGFGADVVVANDTFALLRAGASRPWGVAVVCGAGLNAVGVSPSGEVARFPALGRLSGDWGGGLDLGEEVLWQAVRDEDGRGPATALTAAVRAWAGTGTVEELVLELHFGKVEHVRLHELTPLLFAVAATGDVVARSVVARLAGELALLASVALRRLDLLAVPAEVVLGGGVLTARDPLLLRLLGDDLARRAPRAEPVLATQAPIVGAALNGLDRLGASDTAKTRLRAATAWPTLDDPH